MADPKDETKELVKGESLIAGGTITPVYGNRYTVTVNSQTTRIAVGEFVSGDPNKDTFYHTVIVTPTSDAIALAALIVKLVAKNQARQTEPKDENDNG